MKKTILISIVVFITACQPILMKIYGIKQPKVENQASIQKQALKYGLDNANIVTVAAKDFLHEFWGKNIPDCAVYDKDQRYIEYRQTDTSCNAGLFAFIPALNATTTYHQPPAPSLKEELKKFRDMQGKELGELKKADFYLLIYFTVWTGKLNKDHVKAWEDLAKANKNANIHIIKVNLDFQEYWNETERNDIIKALSKKK